LIATRLPSRPSPTLDQPPRRDERYANARDGIHVILLLLLLLVLIHLYRPRVLIAIRLPSRPSPILDQPPRRDERYANARDGIHVILLLLLLLLLVIIHLYRPRVLIAIRLPSRPSPTLDQPPRRDERYANARDGIHVTLLLLLLLLVLIHLYRPRVLIAIRLPSWPGPALYKPPRRDERNAYARDGIHVMNTMYTTTSSSNTLVSTTRFDCYSAAPLGLVRLFTNLGGPPLPV